jgi:DNA repair photolyase
MSRRADRGDAEAQAIHGRGTASNRAGRFEKTTTELLDDGWGSLEDGQPVPQTVVRLERGRSILSWNESPDLPFDRSINPYRGCEHGCVYCYARPTHAYLGLSPGLDFETQLVAKVDAPALLDKALRQPGYRPGPVLLGANTDAYQPVERTYGLTRQLIEVLLAFGHPLQIITKSAGILRDLDLLQQAAGRNLVHVMVSVTTLDTALARALEPRAAAPQRRIAAIAQLAAAGVPVGVMAAPLIPQLNDHELEAILQAGHDAGARSAGYTLLRLPLELGSLFDDWLRLHHPARAERVLQLVRDSREGQLYRSDFATRMTGTGPYAQLLAQRFALATRRLQMAGERPQLDCSQFAPPPPRNQRQLELF